MAKMSISISDIIDSSRTELNCKRSHNSSQKSTAKVSESMKKREISISIEKKKSRLIPIEKLSKPKLSGKRRSVSKGSAEGAQTTRFSFDQLKKQPVR